MSELIAQEFLVVGVEVHDHEPPARRQSPPGFSQRAFRIVKIRANRDKPGLRPQHLKAVEAAATLSDAVVLGASVG